MRLKNNIYNQLHRTVQEMAKTARLNFFDAYWDLVNAQFYVWFILH